MKAHALTISAAFTLGVVTFAQTVLPPTSPNQPPTGPMLPPTNPMPPVPTMPLQPVAPPPSVSAGTASGVSSGAPGSVTPPISRPDTGAATSADLRGDSRTGVIDSSSAGGSGVESRITVDSRVNGVGARGVVTAESSTSLRPEETVRAIQSTQFSTRDQVTAQVEERLEASANLLQELRGRANADSDAAKATFARSLAEVRQREQNLRESLRAATKATSETSWGAAQSQLAQDYSAYARAVAEAEVAASAR